MTSVLHAVPTPLTTLTPELLLSAAAARVRAARPDLPGDLDLSTPRALRALKAELAEDSAHRAGEAEVVAVVSGFRLADWVRESCRFALSLEPERAEAWRRSFTRTVFLAGRPANLEERFAFDHVATDGSVAWAGPAPAQATSGLRRLLKTFSGRRGLGTWTPTTVAIPAAPDTERRPARRELYVATARVTVSDALVQLHHLLAEAAMDGLIAPGDRLTLRSAPRLTGLTARFAALRVDTDRHRPDALQAYAALTEET